MTTQDVESARARVVRTQALFEFWSGRGGRDTDELLLSLVRPSKRAQAAELLHRIHESVYQAGVFSGRLEERAEEHKFNLMERETRERDRRRKEGA